MRHEIKTVRICTRQANQVPSEARKSPIVQLVCTLHSTEKFRKSRDFRTIETNSAVTRILMKLNTGYPRGQRHDSRNNMDSNTG